MNLYDYLLKEGMTIKDFSYKAGIPYEYIRRYLKGISIPRNKNIFKIYEVTAGQVTPADFYNLPKPANENSDTGPDAA